MTELLPQLFIDGLTLGFIYAIVAVGYTMVYGILEFINFANSEIFMFGAFASTEALLFMQGSGLINRFPTVIALLFALLIAVLLSGSLGFIIERIAYKPIRNSPKLVAFISAIGVSFVLQDAVRLVEGLWKNAFYITTPEILEQKIILSNNLVIPYKVIVIVVISVLTMALLTWFINSSKWGKAMRAVAQDQDTASLMGINVDKTISLTFVIGAALGGVAGTLFSVQYSLVHPYIGFILGIKAFTAAVFGGIGNIPGAMLGGVLLGLLESFGSAYLGTITGGAMGSEYKDVFAFVILIILLVCKPSGLLGTVVREKV